MPPTLGCKGSSLQDHIPMWSARAAWLAAKHRLCPQGKCQGQPWFKLVKDHITSSLCFHQPSILQAQESQQTKINCFSTTCT